MPDIAIIVLYTASAALPLAGLTRLYIEAQRVARSFRESLDGADVNTYEALEAGVRPLSMSLLDRPGEIRRDLWLIGAGLVAGAAASIWSLLT